MTLALRGTLSYGQGMPLLYDLGHVSLTSLSVHLEMSHTQILVTRTLTLFSLLLFSLPICSHLPPEA